MADLVLGALKALWEVLKESIQLQGARGLNLERPRSGDTPLYEVPELQLNMCILSELFVRILAAGLGALALVWATVVLLGGFSTSLQMTDFWVITAIVFIQTARVVGINISPEAELFNQVPPAFLELRSKYYDKAFGRGGPLTDQGRSNKFFYNLRGAMNFIAIMAFLAILVLAVPKIAGLGCISLSIYRLVVLLSRHHDNSNVFRALILFYVLVLLQGGLFIISLCLRLYRSYLAAFVSRKCGLTDKTKFIEKYIDRTLSTAIKNGVSITINRNLASFAADLIKSDHSQDRTEAVLVMHRLTSHEDHRIRTLSQIQSSPLCISRLLDMVTSKSRTDQQTKVWIAEIVAHLAGDLRLNDISGATESIYSMLDPYFTKISTTATNDSTDHQTAIDIRTEHQGTARSASATNGEENIGKPIEEHRAHTQQRILGSSGTTHGAESKPLIIHGLSILAKLAVNPDNCKQIYDFKGLFSKIISPVKTKVYEIPGDYGNGITMEITEKALEVVSMLVRGTDETNGKIRRDICSNGIAVNYIRPILEKKDQVYNKLKIPATKILTELYLDMSAQATIGLDDITQFIKVHPILERDQMYNKIRVPATTILTELYLDMSIKATIGFDDITQFINVLMKIFLDADNESGLRKAAGKALAGLAMDNANCTAIMNFRTGTETSVVQLLTAMIPEANDRLYGTAIAQLLMQFFANPDPNAKREGLESVKTILHEVLRVICNVEQAANVNQAGSPQQNPGQQAAQPNQAGSPQPNPGQPPLVAIRRIQRSVLRPRHSHAANRNAPGDNLPAQLRGGRRKSLAAFLGLFMQICDNLNISANEFDTALQLISLPMDKFVEKLNGIIEQCKDHSVDSLKGKGASVDYLIIFKTVTKLCAWMMQSKPDCINVFKDKDTSTKLQDALEDMRGLELGILLTGSVGDIANYENLSSIVATARQVMDENVQGRSG